MVFMFRSFKMVIGFRFLIYPLFDDHEWDSWAILNPLNHLQSWFSVCIWPSGWYSSTFSTAQELANNDRKIKRSVFFTIKESGMHVLHPGSTICRILSFPFMLSDFGGTNCPRCLIAITLALECCQLLMLYLVWSQLNKSLANEQEF
jgi:hypothetical protein